LPTPENGQIDSRSIGLSPTAPSAVAPVWHTVILIAGIVALSIQSAVEFSKPQPTVNRLQTYFFTGITELALLAWVYFGLRLRRVPFRSLLGSVSGGLRSIAVDLGIAAVFWMASLIVLGTLGIFWTAVEVAVTHHSLFHAGKPLTPDPSQQNAIHTLTQLAPANGREVAAWVLLCIVAGIAEEIIFRGYLHRQFTAWSRGAVAAGVAFSALLFGAAHGYQGVRNMFLLAVFGVLFSMLALFRRSLRAGIFAHCCHDLTAGLMLSLLKAHHIV
jgi:membrane protease YdiL (CAAX protease family)